MAALLIGGGAPQAFAACAISPTTNQSSVSNSAAINCINVTGISVSGNVTNTSTGTLTPAAGTNRPSLTAITINNASVGGAIVNAGHITANPSRTAIRITGRATVSGGLSNSGTVSGGNGIDLTTVAQFGTASAGGGIVNSGTISAAGVGIAMGLSSTLAQTFYGGISNSGVLSAGGSGVIVNAVSLFSGGISNSGTLSAGGPGINVFDISNFSGGIGNSGTISAGGVGIFAGVNAGIDISFPSRNTVSIVISTFTGGISNSGTISAGGAGIWLGGNAGGILLSRDTVSITISTFGGGISNSGTITAGGNGIWAGGNAIVNDSGNANTVSVTISTFSGAIHNSGTIVAGTGNGIWAGGNASIGGATNFRSVASVTISTFAGGISNSGTITAGGNGIWVGGNASATSNFATGNTVAVTISTFDGISNSGTITAGGNGIWVGGNASVSGTGSRIAASVTISTFSGGISNSGTILATGAGIMVGGAASNTAPGNSNAASVTISTFGGGIANSGTINAQTGIAVNSVLTFLGGISNSGTISNVPQQGIFIDNVSVFSGGIANSGTISANFSAVSVQSVSTFAGGISNSGQIIVTGGAGGIAVSQISNFDGGISNSGTISAAHTAINVSGIGQFGGSAGGGITNSGLIVVGSPAAIKVEAVTTFIGSISNSGTISAVHHGIVVSNVTQFGAGAADGIINSGGITVSGAGTAIGIHVLFVSTFAGGITNSGTINAKTGIVVGSAIQKFGGAIANSGTIIGTGGTAIDISAAPNNMTINITGGAITGNILGAGFGSGDTLNFALGSATFTYNSSFENFQTVNIDSGAVVLNGASNSAAAVNVNSGGTLAGNGTVDPPVSSGVNVNSGGTLEPGTPGIAGGMLTIAGSLTFASSSADYEIQLTPTQHSSATVSGNITLNGGTVVLSPLTLGAHYPTSSFSIMAFGGTRSGTFNPTVAYAGTFQLSTTPTISYTATDVDLSYGASVSDLATPAGANQNEQNVINGINAAILGGATVPAGFQQLGNLSGAALLNAYAHLAGEPATDAGKGAEQLMNDFLNLMLDPTAGGGGNVSGGGATQFAPEQDASLPADVALAYAKALKAPQAQNQAPPNFDQRWTAWGSAFGGKSFTDGNAALGTNNVNASDYGFAAGMDYHATPSFTYGFGLAGGGTNWNLAQGLGSGRSDSFQAGVYAKTHWGPFYLSGALAFANHWFTTDRSALGDQLQAKFTGQSYAARGEAGYRYAMPVTGAIVGVTPYAALQVQDFHTPSYSETDLNGGGLGLSYASMNATDTRSELGARFDNLQVVYGMPLVLRGRLAWAHDWFTNPAALNAAFQALPGSSFTVNGAAPPRNSALTTAAAELHINGNWTAIAKFDGDFGSGLQTYGGTGALKYSW